MLATLDHNLLCIDENLDTGKDYSQDFQGYRINTKNKRFFVLHKKEIKLIEIKHIGSTMGVFHINERATFTNLPLIKESLISASQLFEAWDEEKGEKYAFLPYFSPKLLTEQNEILEKLEIDLKLKNTEKGVIASSQQSFTPCEGGRPTNTNYLLEGGGATLFWLTLLYGKFEAKNGQLNSIKIHLPLFWHYLQLQPNIEALLQNLQNEGIFLQSSLNQNGDKTTLQITSNDWELLQMFAEWYKPVENFTQITKKEQTIQATQQVVSFLSQEKIENADEVQAWIEKGTVKVLVKS